MGLLQSSFVNTVLSAVCQALPVSGSSCYQVDEKGNPFAHHLAEMPREQLQAYRQRFHQLDPFHPSRHCERDIKIVSAAEAFMSGEGRHYQQEFLIGHGYCDELEMFFRDGTGRIILGLGLFRADHEGPFRSYELEQARKLMPLLELTLSEQIKNSAQSEMWQSSPLLKKLTKREVEITGFLVKGQSNKEIARQCAVTVATVKAHLFNIYTKTQTSSRVDLVTRILH